MKYFIAVLFALPLIAKAQSPQVTIKGADSSLVKMSQLLVNVKIVGNIAYTTAEMHFTNKSNRQMEAELLFPLPEGVSVSRYAIDINGKIREAVPVNKNKGKQVFEAIEHRRVDPGLLEKVDGNNFKTRIYPIMPNGERIVIIGYEQELASFDENNLSYLFVSKYPQPLEKFTVDIDIIGAASNPALINENDNSLFPSETLSEGDWNQVYHRTIKKENYQPKEAMVIKIPIKKEIPSVVVQPADGQYYFYANTVVESKKIQKATPVSIGLIWDVSLSCKNRDTKKEMDLLDAYFKKLINTKVTLYLLSYNFKQDETFTITNGNWSSLKNKLENLVYDGGTRYSQIKLPAHDEYIFSTDGLSSLSNNDITKTAKPFYTITSSVAADFAFLNYTSVKTGADLINLNRLNTAQALDKMIYRQLRFLGIKENLLVTDVFPMAGTPVSNNFSLAGISLKENNTITMLFGYDGKPAIEKVISISSANKATNGVNIEKLWAQKKIADLELQYDKNAEEIETMGKRYNIVTKNTSLIVLEDINDYIAYEIIPPAELRAEYDKLMKQQRDLMLAQKKSNWDNVETYYDELYSWWKKDIKYVKPKAVKNYSRKKAGAEYSIGSANQAGNKMEDVVMYNAPLTTYDFSTSEAKAAPQAMRENAAREEESDYYSGKKDVNISYDEGNLQTDSVAVHNDDASSNWSDKIEIKEWNPDRLYLKALAAAPVDKRYSLYLQLREGQENNPNFYFDVATQFYNNGDRQTALLILSNITDLGLENHQLYKTVTYVLRQWKAYSDALYTADQIVKWREHEPQSHRDLALTMEDNGMYQQAFDELIKGLEVNYYGEMSGQYEGVEDIILMDINRMITEHKNIKAGKLDKKYIMPMPVAVRVILNWNQMDTDIDMHVIEPNGEECYYGHKDTDAGARFSKDFTQGYGPEQYLLRNAIKGTYKIKTNYFGESTLTENGPATLMVEVYTTKANGITERKLQTIQLGKIKENQTLATVTIN